MKKYAYYHLYLTDDTGVWSSLFLDQVYLTINSGLYAELEKMYVNCIGSQEQINLFVGLCTQFNKIQILNCCETKLNDSQMSSYHLDNYNPHDETITMNELQIHAKREDAYFLYFHTKGVTATSRMKQTGDFSRFINCYNWRKFLEWGCIENWKICIGQLKTHSCAGVNLCDWPSPHYSGTMFWTKSSHVNKLPNIMEDDWWINLMRSTDLRTWNSNRLKAEMWIGSICNSDFYTLKNAPFPPPTSNLSATYFPRSLYQER
jgi:hypothetical protein